MIAAFKKKNGQKKDSATKNSQEMFGTRISFAAKEAYKLLRTNLMFSFSDAEGEGGRIIGMTSSLRGEGKSTTVINLASVLAEQGKRVVVVEGDLRLPSLRKKLKMRVKSGLSDVLIARANPVDYVHACRVGMVDDKMVSFDLLPAGAIPPNPSELLGSRRMEEVLKVLAERYDFVLLDLPPVTAVTDALVATKWVEGVIMVVRSEYCDTRSLNDAIRQLRQVDGKIFGFVLTCANSAVGGYHKKYEYRG